jgi:TonB family protein
MSRDPMSEPKPLTPETPVAGETDVLRARPDDASFEADFADLAARFAAQSGGGLSPELSAELALEIVLNEVVDQACLATGASGAAIVLPRDGEMVCRATSGSTAPQLGARLDAASGLSGECIRTHQTQRCDDVLADPRVDVGASQRLGVRSVMVMPLLRGDELAGLFELFSSAPNVFGERDERTLEALAARVLNNMERAAQPLLPPEPAAVVKRDEVSVVRGQTERVGGEATEIPPVAQHRPVDFVTWSLATAVLACTVFLVVLSARRLGWDAGSASRHSSATARAEAGEPRASAASLSLNSSANTKDESARSVAQPVSVKVGGGAAVPPGGLLVLKDGKEVFRLPPSGRTRFATRDPDESAPSLGSGMQRASSVEPEKVTELPPAVAEGSLLHRVEPEYPEQARLRKIEGAVVLTVRVGEDGAVRDVQFVSGPAELAEASTDAVKQWRFKPHSVDGHPAEMETRVTLNFRLPH